MAVEFGLHIIPGAKTGDHQQWLANMDAAAALMAGHVRSLWVYDHFFYRQGSPAYELWTTMSYLACRYPHYEIGSLVMGQSYRNPALTALMAATLQTLSGGRLILGVGAGYKEDEYRAYGYDYPGAGIRIQQLEEALAIFRKLWTEPGQVSCEGRHYQVKDAWCEPKPDPMIPILVGGSGRKTMRVAAKYADMWNWGGDIAYYSQRLAILKQHCQELERDIATLRLTYGGNVVVGRTEAQAQRLAEDSRSDGPFVGTPAQVAEKMAAFVDIGVDYFLVNIRGLSDPEIAGMVTEELIPAVKKLGSSSG